MQYYIISNPEPVKKEFEIINHLLKNNSLTFHLRKPNFTKNELKRYLDNISESLHHKIVIHNHHNLINDYDLKGIHFTQHNKGNLLDYEKLTCSKSISTHSIDELSAYPFPFDYYFLSPIFQSISKPGYGGDVFNLQELEKFIKSNSEKKIVALGGINANNIAQIASLGFHRAAILGTFWQYCEVLSNYNDINKFFETLDNKISI